MAEYGTGCLVSPSKNHEPIVRDFLAEYSGTKHLAAAALAILEVVRAKAESLYPGKESLDTTGVFITGRLNSFGKGEDAKLGVTPTAAMRERAESCFASCDDPHALGRITLTAFDLLARKVDSRSRNQRLVAWILGLPDVARKALTKNKKPLSA